MVKHIVLFKLKDFSSQSEKEQASDEVIRCFGSLEGKIPEIREFRVRADKGKSPSSYDVVIDSVFDTWKDLRAYQAHPAHQEAVILNKAWSSGKVVIDYEI